MTPTGTSLLQQWRERRDGFAPLFLETVMAPALEHLEGAVRPGAVVLDLGSGSGHVAHAVRACGGETICLDVDPVVVAESRRRYPGGAHLAADAARLPLADASVDAIFCFSVLQYTHRDRALAEMRRVLRPGGRVAHFHRRRSRCVLPLLSSFVVDSGRVQMLWSRPIHHFADCSPWAGSWTRI